MAGAVGAAIVYFALNRKKEDADKEGAFLLIQQQMSELARALDTKLSESRRDMQETVRTQFSESQKLIKDINEQMSKKAGEAKENAPASGTPAPAPGAPAAQPVTPTPAPAPASSTPAPDAPAPGSGPAPTPTTPPAIPAPGK